MIGYWLEPRASRQARRSAMPVPPFVVQRSPSDLGVSNRNSLASPQMHSQPARPHISKLLVSSLIQLNGQPLGLILHTVLRAWPSSWANLSLHSEKRAPCRPRHARCPRVTTPVPPLPPPWLFASPRLGQALTHGPLYVII